LLPSIKRIVPFEKFRSECETTGNGRERKRVKSRDEDNARDRDCHDGQVRNSPEVTTSIMSTKEEESKAIEKKTSLQERYGNKNARP